MSSATNQPRLVRYPLPSDFIRAVLPFDTWHLNLDLGSTMDTLAEDGDTAGEPGRECLWLAVWTGGNLDLTLFRTPNMITIGSPHHTDSLSPAWLSARLRLFAQEIHRLVSTNALSGVTVVRGANALVEAFTARYDALSGRIACTRSVPLTNSILAHCPRARVSLEPPTLPKGHTIRVVDPDDQAAMQELTNLVRAFRTMVNGPTAKVTLQAAVQAEEGARLREIIVYVVTDAEGNEQFAGFVRHSRVTLKFAAIHNVYTLPQWRRHGIAETLTRAAVVHLVSKPHALKKELASRLPDIGTEVNVEDVCIFTAADFYTAQGVYRKVGFGFPGQEWDEQDGKSWESSIEVEYSSNERVPLTVAERLLKPVSPSWKPEAVVIPYLDVGAVNRRMILSTGNSA